MANKENMKKYLFFLILCTFLLLGQTTLAGRGCCSRHGGVSHCDTSIGRQVCNDGTYSPSPSCNCGDPPPPPPKITSQDKLKIVFKINSVKDDYPTHHQGFRESLIQDILKLTDGNFLDNIGYYIYTKLPDIQDENRLYEVQRVIDGDTIAVSIDGKEEKLRLIGIDTPETVDPRKPVQCFGREASDKAKEILSDKMVRLESDSTQSNRDKYQRLLRYVFLEDGTFFNKLMIEEGYAHEYTYQSNPYKYQAEFMEAEKQARENNRGLWSPDTCNGDTTR